MAAKKSVKKYVGVYYTESKIRKWRERPDRCYWVAFKDARTGKLRWERCGWASEGWTPEAAQRRRHELLEEDRTGEYKPKVERKADLLTFGELLEKHYLPWADENKRRARDDRSMYRSWLESRLKEKTLKEISSLDLERLKKDMRQAGKAEATVKHALCLVREAYNKGGAWRLYNGENPCKGVSFPKPNNARQRFLTPEAADRLLIALGERSPQIARVATLSLYAGLRLGEVFNLRWKDVDIEHGILHVMDTKNRESRPAFVTEPIRELLKELTPGLPEEPLFATKAGDPVVWLSKAFKKTVDSMGLNKGINDPRQKVTFHSLRHTFASRAIMAGVPIYVVGKALGHKSTAMTQRYSHLAPESQKTAFEAVAKAGLPVTPSHGREQITS
jgi:integrase